MTMKQRYLFTLLFLGVFFQTLAQSNLTGEDIINKSIEFCGGKENLSKIKSSNLIYDFYTSDDSHASLIIKREISKSYMRTVLSQKHIASSMHYYNLTLTLINGEEKKVISDINKIEEIKLQTYNQPQYGYKELSYKFKRLDDQKFSHFDCYTVSATDKNGYTTLNYFDKTNFRLIMIIYPNGNKSILMEYEFKDNVLFNTQIINVEENSEQTRLVLQKIENNIKINPLWFKLDNSNSTSVPDSIKTGTFVSADSTLVNRTASVQTEQNDNFNQTLILAWFNNYIFAMVNSKSINKSPLESRDNILVKIVSWNKDEYVCHYYSNGISGTQEYKIKNN